MQWALINGEKQTGVSIFRLEKTLDTGPVIIQKKIDIEDIDSASSLFEKLVPLGIEALNEAVGKFEQGSVCHKPQDGEPSWAPTLSREHGHINWGNKVVDIINLMRGTHPWPGCFSIFKSGNLKDKRVKIIKASVYDNFEDFSFNKFASGSIVKFVKNEGFVVKAKDGLIIIKDIQPENKKL